MNTMTEEFQILLTQTELPVHFFLYVALSVVLVVVLGNALFAYSVYKTAKLVNKEYRRFPLWLLWFFLIPIINIVFQILILVFDLPRGLKLTFQNNPSVVTASQSLFSIGLTAFILMLLAWGLSGFVSLIMSLVSLILVAVYWAKVVKVRSFCVV